jgi:signal transduction histidine kinase
MNLSHARLAPRSWLRLPRRTARLRLAALYGGLFLISGVALLASTYVLFERATEYHNPHLPTIPHTPAIQPLRQKPPFLLRSSHAQATQPIPLPQALSKLAQDQYQLTQAQRQLKRLPAAAAGPGSALLLGPAQLARDEQQLTRGQHQLAQAVYQLSQAVHQVAQAGSAQAALRASDSHQLLVDSGIALAVVGVIALLAGWFVAGRMLRPIRTITRKARRISSTSLHERLALGGPEDELKELADTLDDLFGRLDAAFEAQRRFVANASHELRTPLTRERALVQVALGDPSTSDVWRSTGQELLASNREQETLIESLLTLASSESGLDHRERTDLADICQNVLSHPGLDTQRLGLHIETAVRAAPLEGDPRLIERLIANLVDNAVAYNVTGGLVQISTASTDGQAVLSVSNTGPIIPPAELGRLFQPFQRLAPRRTNRKGGHGLGLSIVQAIATAHHATISPRPLPEGGLALTVAFPSPISPNASSNRPLRARRFTAGQTKPVFAHSVSERDRGSAARQNE